MECAAENLNLHAGRGCVNDCAAASGQNIVGKQAAINVQLGGPQCVEAAGFVVYNFSAIHIDDWRPVHAGAGQVTACRVNGAVLGGKTCDLCAIVDVQRAAIDVCRLVVAVLQHRAALQIQHGGTFAIAFFRISQLYPEQRGGAGGGVVIPVTVHHNVLQRQGSALDISQIPFGAAIHLDIRIGNTSQGPSLVLDNGHHLRLAAGGTGQYPDHMIASGRLVGNQQLLGPGEGGHRRLPGQAVVGVVAFPREVNACSNDLGSANVNLVALPVQRQLILGREGLRERHLAQVGFRQGVVLALQEDALVYNGFANQI